MHSVFVISRVLRSVTGTLNPLTLSFFFLPGHVCRSLALLRVKAIKLCVPVERTALELVFGVRCKKIPFVIFIRWRGTQLKVCVGKAPGSQSFNGFETTRSAW